MTASCSLELQIIKTAILNEHEGWNFYQMAAEKADTQEVKDVFLYLAQEEKNHENQLKELYEGVVKEKQEMNEPTDPCQPIKSDKVFSPENLKMEQASLVVSALSVGVLMEKDSIEFYREAAQKTSLEAAKKIYLQLAQWEEQHLETLSKAYEFAKEEWWAEQGFSPA